MVYLAEKNGEPTRYNVFRQEIDRAIVGAMTKQQFENILRLQGFEMKPSANTGHARLSVRGYRTMPFAKGPEIPRKRGGKGKRALVECREGSVTRWRRYQHDTAATILTLNLSAKRQIRTHHP